MDHRKLPLRRCLLVLGITLGATARGAPDSIDNAVYFHSQVRDAAGCAPRAEQGRIVFPGVTNPAATCPDAFAWAKFLEAVQAGFWANWAYDGFTWPAEPYALCAGGEPPGACCTPGGHNSGYDDADNPGIHCPYFPGDHAGKAPVVARPAFKQHFSQYQTGHASLAGQADPGRVIRQEMAEVVYRNRPMWAYVFEHDLYNEEGLGARFQATAKAIGQSAPYRPEGVRIEFPVGSVMFKSDWLHEDEARKLGLHQNDEHPYVTMRMRSAVGDNDAGRFREGLHYLVAVTAASKDLPNWHWYAMEHVDNPGRCDYIGCNDAFGYATADPVPQGFARNFTRPRTRSDGLVSASPVFETGKAYPSGTLTPALDALYRGLGIAQKDDGDPATPSPGDRAWRSYRLKGTQTEFTTGEGVVTVVGNSVTEGGFVNSSSCMSCHAQATVDATGSVAIGSFGFAAGLNLTGYAKSANGPPDPAWFYGPGSGSTTPMAVQADFVWGVLFANGLVSPEKK